MGKFNRRGIGGGDGNASALERLFGAVLDVASTTRACSLPYASLKLLPTGPNLFSRKGGEAAHPGECRLSGHAGDRTTLAPVAAWPCGWGALCLRLAVPSVGTGVCGVVASAMRG
jgi:hypothetical protein